VSTVKNEFMSIGKQRKQRKRAHPDSQELQALIITGPVPSKYKLPTPKNGRIRCRKSRRTFSKEM
jgi:hypothetical protein